VNIGASSANEASLKDRGIDEMRVSESIRARCKVLGAIGTPISKKMAHQLPPSLCVFWRYFWGPFRLFGSLRVVDFWHVSIGYLLI
jgi:hypothetical protein